MLELSSEIAENNKGIFTQDNRNLKPEMYVCMETILSEMGVIPVIFEDRGLRFLKYED